MRFLSLKLVLSGEVRTAAAVCAKGVSKGIWSVYCNEGEDVEFSLEQGRKVRRQKRSWRRHGNIEVGIQLVHWMNGMKLQCVSGQAPCNTDHVVGMSDIFDRLS